MFRFVNWYLEYTVYPIIGLTGLAANIVGLLVISKCGLKRVSNVLLFYLTLADIFCLLGTVQICISSFYLNVSMIHRFDGVLVVVYACVLVLSETGFSMSIQVTVWITIERLLAVFFPLRLTTLVTPVSVWLLGLATFTMAYGLTVYLYV